MGSDKNSVASVEPAYRFKHLLGIEGLMRTDIEKLLDLSDRYVESNRLADKKHSTLRGRTLINLFFENSTRTSTSFELAGETAWG
jgi:aspartate carbamoyltransferase catalytic subunit